MNGERSGIRVFLLDDHEVVRRGLVALLEAEPDIAVVGEAATAREALARIAATKPDVAVLDVRLPDGSGIDVCRELCQSEPPVPCLILTAYDDDEALRAAVMAGAAGYVVKDVRASGLLDAVRAVASGKRLIDAATAQKVATQLAHSRRDATFDSLGLREHQVLALIGDGLTNRQIAQRLGLAEKTVKNYVSSLLAKLGLEHRTQAAILLLEHAREDTRSRPRL
jgi:Response regulator containing a CheY-like receiver domain and an HTH DNA-binding domain